MSMAGYMEWAHDFSHRPIWNGRLIPFLRTDFSFPTPSGSLSPRPVAQLLQEEPTAPTSTASADWLVGKNLSQVSSLPMRCAIFAATWILKNRT